MTAYIHNIQDHVNNHLEEIKAASDIYIFDKEASIEVYDNLLSYCPQITSLTFRTPGCVVLPDLKNFKFLKTLVLDCPNLTTLSDMSSLKRLKQLYLTCPNLTTIPTKCLPDTLEGLQCKTKKLEAIDSTVWTNKNLTTVSFSGEGLKRLEFPNDTSIEKLSAYSPDLTEIKFGVNSSFTKISITSKSLNHLPVSFSNLKRLEELTIKAPIEQVSCEFSKAINLKECRFYAWNLKDYSFLKSLKYLHELTIVEALSKWCNLPDLSYFEYLEKLYISEYEESTLKITAPEAVTIRYLSIHNSNTILQPQLLAKCPHLKRISLEQMSPINFPDYVTHLPMLNGLSIAKTPILNFHKIPPDTLLEWRSLRLEDNNFQVEHFDFIKYFKELNSLEIEGNITSPYVFLSKKTVPLYNIPTSIKGYKFKNNKQFLSICSSIELSGLPKVDKKFFVDYFMSIPKITIPKEWDWKLLLKATTLSLPTIKKKLLKVIDTKMEEALIAHPITSTSVIYVTGTPTIKSTKLNQILKDLQVERVLDYSDRVTHVLIGWDSQDYDLLDQQSFTPLTETRLQKIANQQKPQLLKKSLEKDNPQAAEMIASMEVLLLSPDMINFRLGLEMIEQGGLPKEIFGTLLILQKTSIEPKVRKEVKSLLEIHAEGEWLDLVRDSVLFIDIDSSHWGRRNTMNKLRALAKRLSPFIAGKFSCLLFQKLGKGLAYTLTSRSVPIGVKNEAYQLFIKDHHLNFTNDSSYTNSTQRQKTDKVPYSNTTAIPYPTPHKDLPIIYKLTLGGIRLHKLSKKIIQYKDLKQLNLAINNFTELPAWLAKLKNLETIDLRDNYFKEFPMVLAKLPKLKKIDFRDNPCTEVPSDFISKNPICEVLID